MSPAEGNRRKWSLLTFLAAGLIVIFALLSGSHPAVAAPPQTSAAAQSVSTASADTPTASTQEMASHDEAPNFKVNVRLVEVHVVVRDSSGKAIGTLGKDDFQLFDDRKLQVITKFSVQQPGLQVAREQQTSRPVNAVETGSTVAAPEVPERYIAYVFDDVHMEVGDLAQVRQAAEENLSTLQPTDRAAVFTISGQHNLDFTDDQAKLRNAMERLMPRPLAEARVNDCPKMSYYLADQILNRNDPQALAAVTADVLDCQFSNDPRMQAMAQNVAQSAAAQGLATGDAETHLTLTSIMDVIRRVSALPGQRCVVLVSPGFIAPQQQYDLDRIIDRSTHANITISSLDARGLYVVIPGGDISNARAVANPAAAGIEGLAQISAASANADVMALLADATGGVFFHNNNDLGEGFRRVASAPEYYYVLAFSPQNLKLNGRFHNLKVTLKTPQKYSIQARRGYFAPKQTAGPEQEAKQEIEDALFSQEELHDLPIDLHTQFFKPSDGEAKLTVLAHIDLKQLHFHKAGGRNNNDLTIVSGVFDRNGTFLVGNERVLQMRLKDETLARMAQGVSLKSNFDVKPGSYLVRLVVRDIEGQIAAENGAIQIP